MVPRSALFTLLRATPPFLLPSPEKVESEPIKKKLNKQLPLILFFFLHAKLSNFHLDFILSRVESVRTIWLLVK